MSFLWVNEKYLKYLESQGSTEDILQFKDYLLSRDTLIIPEMGDLLCSPWVAQKINVEPDEIKNRRVYKDDNTYYFIYSKYFDGVWEVKVFFDTTAYITSQIVIIKIGLIFIFFVTIFQYFLWKYISGRLLRDLKIISKKLKEVNIHTNNKHIICNMPPEDEIRILAEALNNSYDIIDEQTKTLKQFLTDVSHEFKTPLMSMSSELDVLDKRQEKTQLQAWDVQNHIHRAKASIKKLNTLLETLFFVSQIEEKNQQIQKKEIKLLKFLESKIETQSYYFPEKDITINYNVPKNLLILADENTFSILLDNIISNAIKFSQKQVYLEIVADEKSLQISDKGRGIASEDLEKIWEKFYRKDYNTQWFGVGLYLVRRIVQMYNWEIQVESKLGEGTVITLFYRK